MYLWLAPKVLPLGNEKPKNFVFCFAFRSFIRTFAAAISKNEQYEQGISVCYHANV